MVSRFGRERGLLGPRFFCVGVWVWWGLEGEAGVSRVSSMRQSHGWRVRQRFEGSGAVSTRERPSFTVDTLVGCTVSSLCSRR